MEEIHAVTGIDPWFLDQLNQIVEMEKFICGQDVNDLDEDLLRRAKEWGFSDQQLGILLNCELRQVRARREGPAAAACSSYLRESCYCCAMLVPRWSNQSKLSMLPTVTFYPSAP